jgi:hypothetical protein
MHCSCDTEEIEISSDSGAYGEIWRNLPLAGVWGKAVGFVFVRLARIWLQSLEDILLFDLL